MTPTIGFTGHVNDADTGLVYMQQRYYDPVAGRFLSVDPVVTDANKGGSFNRYAYAKNSPYKYIDPDGRQALAACIAGPVGCGIGIVVTIAVAAKVASDTSKVIQAHNNSGTGSKDTAPSGNAPTSTPGDKAVGISSTLPKPPTGPGSVPKADRDPKRLFNPGERADKREEQGHKCGNGCGTDIDQSNSAGHHVDRHADGGRSVPENHAEVCTDCHKELHSGE